MTISAEQVLKVVWGGRKGFVFLPYKDPTDPDYPKRGWHETSGIPYDGKAPKLQLPDGVDTYFCPVVFSEPHRKKENALSTNVLWADLDPIHPDSCRIRPSIAWESSPGRYQSLWFLSEEVGPDEAAELSKRIAYGDNADKGGWDLTQVLRIPGSNNYKYGEPKKGKLLWAKNTKYSPDRIRSAYPTIKPNGSPSMTKSHTELEWGMTSSAGTGPSISEALIQTAIASLPTGTRKRLFASTRGADRSMELQKLSRDLLRQGLDSSVVYHLLQRSTWNKFAGRQDEQSSLQKQIADAQSYLQSRKLAASKNSTTTSNHPAARAQDADMTEVKSMEVLGWTDFLTLPTSLKWLVEEAWVDHTVGFISGRSKSYKTWIALDLALSILSGTDFLGMYPVSRTGPVILIQEEDPRAILQERLRLISKAKGMLPRVTISGPTKLVLEFPEYPLYIINLQGFSLTDPHKMQEVLELITRVKPVMVIVDPLVNVVGEIDEHRATEVVKVLKSMKMWREEFGCSVCVVHHWNKTKSEEGDRGGAHMYGSFALHAWLESALHIEPIIPEDGRIDTVTVEKEFKAAPGSRTLKLKFTIDTEKEFTYEVGPTDAANTPMASSLLDIIDASDEWMTTAQLLGATGFSRPKLVETLGKLARDKKIEYQKGGGRGIPSSYRKKQPEALK